MNDTSQKGAANNKAFFGLKNTINIFIRRAFHFRSFLC